MAASTATSLPTRARSRRTSWSAPAVLVLLLSACGGADEPTAAPTGATKASSSPTSSPASTPKLPGIKEFGLTEEQFTAHVEKTQSLVAACMTAAGFEYVPVDVQTIEAAQKRVRSDPGYTRQTYKQKWGLGVTTRFDDPVRDTGLGPQNLRIIAALPPADKAAYHRTLFGENPHSDMAFTLDEEDFSETGGCTRKALAQVFTADQLKGTYVNPKDVLVDSDPRIVKARNQWAKCMRSAGYDYVEDQDEIIEEYADQLDELLDGDDPASLTGSRATALKELQEEEVAVALADLDCQIKHTDQVYHQVELEVFGQAVSG